MNEAEYEKLINSLSASVQALNEAIANVYRELVDVGAKNREVVELVYMLQMSSATMLSSGAQLEIVELYRKINEIVNESNDVTELLRISKIIEREK